MHRGIRKKRESDETEWEKKGQTNAERVLNLTEFGDRRTDELEKRVLAMAQKEEARMETKQSLFSSESEQTSFMSDQHVSETVSDLIISRGTKFYCGH